LLTRTITAAATATTEAGDELGPALILAGIDPAVARRIRDQRLALDLQLAGVFVEDQVVAAADRAVGRPDRHLVGDTLAGDILAIKRLVHLDPPMMTPP
jgi:hypothetical protein